jgi:hypothetical protein
MTACVSMLKSCAPPNRVSLSLCNEKRETSNSADEQTPLSDIDFILRQQEVGWDNELSAPSNIVLSCATLS